MKPIELGVVEFKDELGLKVFRMEATKMERRPSFAGGGIGITPTHRLIAVPLDSKYVTAQDVLDRLRPFVEKTKRERKMLIGIQPQTITKLIAAFDALCAEVKTQKEEE